MENLRICPNGPLQGIVRIDGAKNAALPVIAASILTEEPCCIQNVPVLSDIQNMLYLLEAIGSIIHTSDKHQLYIENANINSQIASYDFTCRLRASFLIAGPLLARFGKFKIALPGGCKIGTRPIDLHLKGFTALGASIYIGHGYVEATASALTGARIYLDFPSVGATENIMMVATKAIGTTIIENAAAEPEILDLANFLHGMGAKITGAGTDTIIIEGMSTLHGTTHEIIPDRIEAGTFMTAAAITGGSLKIENVIPAHVKPLCAKLREMGITIHELQSSLLVEAGSALCPTDIKTLPYPGFPTDMQAQLCALMSMTNGTGIITETIFENRFMYVNELKRMGADITIEGRAAIIKGTAHLSGAQVSATDLRAGAALVLAGLVAEGETILSGVSHIRRGYADLAGKLRSVGASIQEF